MSCAEYWLLSGQVRTCIVVLIAAAFGCCEGAPSGCLAIPGKQSAPLFLESDT